MGDPGTPSTRANRQVLVRPRAPELRRGLRELPVRVPVGRVRVDDAREAGAVRGWAPLPRHRVALDHGHAVRVAAEPGDELRVAQVLCGDDGGARGGVELVGGDVQGHAPGGPGEADDLGAGDEAVVHVQDAREEVGGGVQAVSLDGVLGGVQDVVGDGEAVGGVDGGPVVAVAAFPVGGGDGAVAVGGTDGVVDGDDGVVGVTLGGEDAGDVVGVGVGAGEGDGVHGGLRGGRWIPLKSNASWCSCTKCARGAAPIGRTWDTTTTVLLPVVALDRIHRPHHHKEPPP